MKTATMRRPRGASPRGKPAARQRGNRSDAGASVLQRALQVGTTGLLGPGPLAQLQHAAGNAAVAQLLQSGMTTVQRDAEAINVPIADGSMGFSPKARLFVGGKQAVPEVAFTSDAPLPF